MPDRPMTTDGHNAKRACVRVCLYVEYIHTYMYMQMCVCVRVLGQSDAAHLVLTCAVQNISIEIDL